MCVDGSLRSNTTSAIPASVMVIPRIPVKDSVSFRKRNAISAVIAGAADIINEPIRASLYSYDLKRNVSPKTNPTKPLSERNRTCTADTFTGIPKTIIVTDKKTTAATSRTTFTYTEPTRTVAAAKARALPVHIIAVIKALNSPAYGMKSTIFSSGNRLMRLC